MPQPPTTCGVSAASCLYHYRWGTAHAPCRFLCTYHTCPALRGNFPVGCGQRCRCHGRSNRLLERSFCRRTSCICRRRAQELLRVSTILSNLERLELPKHFNASHGCEQWPLRPSS